MRTRDICQFKNVLLGVLGFVVIIFLVEFAWLGFRKLQDRHELDKYAEVDRNLLDISTILITDIAQTSHWPNTREEVETALSNKTAGTFDSESLSEDPFSDGKLVIKCVPGEIIIYSVGPDKIDNGGSPELTPTTQARLPGDIVLRLCISDGNRDKCSVTHRGQTREVSISNVRTILDKAGR